MENDQTIGQTASEVTDNKITADKPQPEPQQPITSSWQSEMQQQQPGWPMYQMPMMPMPQMFNQFFQQGMKPGYGDFYVRRSKEEQQLQNQQQYSQMFEPQFGYQQFMPMFPMMPPFFNNNMNSYYNGNYENNEQQQQEEQDNTEKEKVNQNKQEDKGKHERYNRNQKYQKKQYKPKYGRNYQAEQEYQPQQQQQRTKAYKQVLQQQPSQQNKSRIRIDSDSFPALPEQKFIYQKKEIQDQNVEKQSDNQQEQQQQQQKIFTEPKIFYKSSEIEKIFYELKYANQIQIHENLSKLEKNQLPIILAEGCLQLEIIEPSKIAKRIEEKSEIYYEKEKSKRKNTYDNSNIASRHKFSLQITTYEKKEVK